jgi:PAS domain S-box-containing protein
MNYYSLLSVASAIFFGMMGYYVLKINLRSSLNHVFFGVVLCYFVFSLGYIFIFPAEDEKTFWFWYKLTSWSWILIFGFILHFYLLLAKADRVIPGFKYLIYLIYIPGIIFYAILLKDHLFIRDILRGPRFWIEVPNTGSFLFPLFHVYYISYILIAFIAAFISIRFKKYEIERKQIQWIIVLGIINTIISVITNSINPILGVTVLPPLGHITAIFWIGGIYLMINRFNLLRDTSAQIYQQALSRIMDMIVVIDPGHKIIKTSTQLNRTLLYESHELLNTRFERLVEHDEKLEPVWNELDSLNLEQHKLEMNLLSKNGTTISCTGTISPIRNRFGDIESYVIVFNDIRQLKLLEREIQDRKKIELQLKEIIHEKEVMMREIHHRVKNNLNLIISLLGLEIESSSKRSRPPLMILKSSQTRIQVMAYLYEYLYRSENLASMKFLNFVKYMMNNFFYLYGKEDKRIEILYSIPEEVDFKIQTMVPLGMIINELYSNSLFHAFHKTGDPMIKITLLMYPDSRYCLQFSDNGSGIDHCRNIEEYQTLGFKLIAILSSQLKGNAKISCESGTLVEINFKEIG